MTNYKTKQELLDNAYADFTMSDDWAKCLTKISDVNPKLEDLISDRGIGTRLLEDGSYDFESGQLLEDLDLDFELGESEYNLVVELAEEYELYAKEMLKKLTGGNALV